MRTYTFEVNDKQYTIKFDYNAICDIEELSGKGIMQLLENPSLNTIRFVLWGGLKWKNQGLTKQQVGFIINDLTSENKYKEVAENLFKCLEYALKQMNGESGEETVGE